jgi:NADPH:quinone reductase-like Zn-dependent oxidoreductase
MTSSMKHENYLKTLGATHVLDRNLPVLLEVKKIANQSIPFVFDAIGDRSTQQAGLDILAPGGTLVTVLAEKVKAQDKTMIHVVALLKAPPHLKLLETLYRKKLSGWLEEGVIKVSESRDVWEIIRLMTFCDSLTKLNLFPVVWRQFLRV